MGSSYITASHRPPLDKMCNSIVGHLGYSTIQSRTRNFKHLRSPNIVPRDKIPLCSQAGRYDNPIPTRFLALIDCLKIPAQMSRPEVSYLSLSVYSKNPV